MITVKNFCIVWSLCAYLYTMRTVKGLLLKTHSIHQECKNYYHDFIFCILNEGLCHWSLMTTQFAVTFIALSSKMDGADAVVSHWQYTRWKFENLYNFITYFLLITLRSSDNFVNSTLILLLYLQFKFFN